MMSWEKEKEEIVRVSKHLYEKGLVSEKSGNLSIRVKDDIVLITPKSNFYEKLEASDIVTINLRGEILEGNREPSSEKKLHIEIYKARGDVNAIIHVHSLFACTMAALELNLPLILDEQEIILGGQIEVAQYAPPGSLELALNAVKALGNKRAVFLSRHGAVSVAENINEAVIVCKILEKLCQTYLLMRMIKK